MIFLPRPAEIVDDIMPCSSSISLRLPVFCLIGCTVFLRERRVFVQQCRSSIAIRSPLFPLDIDCSQKRHLSFGELHCVNVSVSEILQIGCKPETVSVAQFTDRNDFFQRAFCLHPRWIFRYVSARRVNDCATRGLVSPKDFPSC